MSGLGSGSYSVVISDANGCSEEVMVEIPEPNELLVSSQVDDATCFGMSDGEAALSAEGGTAPYSYNWSTGENGASLSEMPAGIYTVVTTDANQCSEETAVEIGEPLELIAGTTIENPVTCFGTADGILSSFASRGVEPYSFTWSNGEESAEISGLSSGVYTVSITDANGCTTESSGTLSEPDEIITSISQEGELLVADQSGAEYQWVSCENGMTPIPGATLQTFSPIQKGSFAVSITMGECVESSECFELTSLSIGENDVSDINITVFPNPTKGILNIDLKETRLAKGSIRLFDLNGKILESASINSDLVQLDLSHLSSGIYFLDIEGIRKKIIITE